MTTRLQPPADTVFLGGTVHTVDDHDATVSAVAVRNGRIQATGDDATVRALVGEHTDVVDLRGRTMVPGFTDPHVHLEMASVALSLMTSIHTPPNDDIPTLLEGLRAACADRPAGEWVIGQGNLFHDMRFEEQRYPTREELDSVSTEHPIVLRHGAHVTVVNTPALETFGIDADTEPPPGGVIFRHDDGTPTGLFMEMYKYLGIPGFTDEQKRAAIPATAREYFLRYGVTCVGEISDTLEGVRLFHELTTSGELPLRIALYARTPRPIDHEALAATGFPTGFGNDHFYLAGVKVFADGGISARLAATHEPYPGTDSRGKLVYTRDELAAIVRTCNEAGLQPIIHCAGDLAMDMVTEIYAEELAQRPREDHRWRIEHIGNPFATDERLERMRAVGLLPVPNPPHLYSIGDQFEGLVGPRGDELGMRMKTLVDMGFRPPSASDLTGSHPESSNPFMGMWHCVARETFGGKRLDSAEALTAREALRSYTIDGAHAVFQDHIRGSIEPGKLADLVVCDRDPLRVSDDELRHVKVLETYIDGVLVWQDA
ncbi:MAG: amidohydrolase [Actinobacteria bacterium]|jgi:predicted amidohydrolase YtcJ|nr:amidohydrolase [Actinomycetota bacterium]